MMMMAVTRAGRGSSTRTTTRNKKAQEPMSEMLVAGTPACSRITKTDGSTSSY